MLPRANRADRLGVAHDRADGHRQRKQHEEQQNQRHQRHRRPATSAERGLQPQHERPRGDHQRGRPHRCREKRLQNKKRDGYQAENRQDGKRRARQVEWFVAIGHSNAGKAWRRQATGYDRSRPPDDFGR